MNSRKKTILFIVSCVFSLFLVEREKNEKIVIDFESSYVNWLLDTKKERKEPSSVTLLTLDDSEESVIQDWPPSPLDYAVILNNLKQYDPKLIAIEPSLEFLGQEEGLIETLRTACLAFNQQSLLLSAVCQMDRSIDPTIEKGENFFDIIDSVNGDTTNIPEFTRINSLPNQRFAAMGLPIAFTRIDLADNNNDEGIYKFPLIARIGDKIVPSFVLKAIMLDFNIKADQVIINIGDNIKLGNRKIIPIDNGGHVQIYPALQDDLSIEKINLLTVPPDELDGKYKLLLGNRIILIGNNQNSESIKNIPFRNNSKISNAEHMALAISTIQSGLFISEVSKNKEILIWSILILIGAMILKSHSLKAFSRIGLLIIIYLSFSMLL
ncbi:MAG: CHASE2 domain-containing protein, partial [Verrucomicrobiota bacterium]|nr:CHASE2 domain-containing protein [Verrucomicrobiota bacterium]